MAEPTVFAGAPFCRVWADAFGLRWEPLEGHEGAGLVFGESRRLGLRDYQLAPRGLYWGGSPALVESAVRQCLSRRTVGITWSFRYDAEDEMAALQRELGEGSFRIVESETQVVPIEGRSYDELFSGALKAVTRRQVRKAEDSAVGIRRISTDHELAEHYRLYRSWTDRCGIEAHPPRLFSGLVSELDDGVALWGAYDEGRLVAAVLVFRDDREWFYWHGVRDRDRDRHFAVDGLLAHAFREACSRNVRFFNMGASSGVESLEFFKHRWGAERRPVWTVRWTDAVWSPVLSSWQRFRHHAANAR